MFLIFQCTALYFSTLSVEIQKFPLIFEFTLSIPSNEDIQICTLGRWTFLSELAGQECKLQLNRLQDGILPTLFLLLTYLMLFKDFLIQIISQILKKSLCSFKTRLSAIQKHALITHVATNIYNNLKTPMRFCTCSVYNTPHFILLVYQFQFNEKISQIDVTRITFENSSLSLKSSLLLKMRHLSNLFIGNFAIFQTNVFNLFLFISVQGRSQWGLSDPSKLHSSGSPFCKIGFDATCFKSYNLNLDIP